MRVRLLVRACRVRRVLGRDIPGLRDDEINELSDVDAEHLIRLGLAEKPFSVSPVPKTEPGELETATLSGGPSAAVRVKKTKRRKKASD